MPDEGLGHKKDFGVNGKHTQLGKSFSMDEFKGYTLATMKEMKERVQRMDEYYTKQVEKSEERMKDCEDSVEGIEKWKSNLEGKIAVLMVIFTVIGTAVLPVVNAVLQRLGGN